MTTYGLPSAWITFWEDFITDVESTTWVETAGSSAVQDANVTAPTHGGWWQQQMDASDDDDLNLGGAEIVYEVDEGSPLVFETRARPSTISAQCAYAGMSDANTEASGASAIDSESGTLTATATDGVYFLLDESSASTLDTTWGGASINAGALVGPDGVLGTQSNIALLQTAAAQAAIPQVLRLTMTAADSGTARFAVGKEAGFAGGINRTAAITGAFTSSVVMCPILGTEARGVDTDMDWDYVYVNVPRT